MPSRRHRSLTVTSQRKPSSTMRIFSSGLYLRRVTDLTRRTKDLVCRQCLVCVWLGQVRSFREATLPSLQELTPPPHTAISSRSME